MEETADGSNKYYYYSLKDHLLAKSDNEPIQGLLVQLPEELTDIIKNKIEKQAAQHLVTEAE
jgi:hypothetical protein